MVQIYYYLNIPQINPLKTLPRVDLRGLRVVHCILAYEI